jgi:hypothetical protein
VRASTVDYGDFFVTGDEWGLVEVVPAENREHYAEVARQFAEHHKDTEFGPTGWTTRPFILPGPAVPLSVRAIRAEEVTAAFANLLIPTERVTSCVDFTGPPEPLTGCVAWKVPSDKAFVAGFYGRVTDGVLASFWWSPHPFDKPTTAALADAIACFGMRHRLLLAVGGEGVIDFEDRETMATYLSYYHDE